MITPLARWVFTAMIYLLGVCRPPSDPPGGPNPPLCVAHVNIPRLRELVIIAITAADASSDTPLPGKTARETAAQLVAISFLESGFMIRARGALGEVGPWQLLGVDPRMRLRAQAGMAIYRWRVQGAAGYTGEAGQKKHPLADHRIALAARLLENVP